MQSIKVFYNGKRLRDVYPHATAYQVFKWKVRRFVRHLVIVLVCASAILAILYSAFVYGTRQSAIVYRDKIVKVPIDNLEAKVNQIKSETLSVLKSCESAGHSEDDGIIIFDSNAKASIGQLQFQKATVIYYYKLLYGKTISGKDATLIALDTDKALTLAQDIIFKNGTGDREWVNCFAKHKLNDRVKMVKILES